MLPICWNPRRDGWESAVHHWNAFQAKCWKVKFQDACKAKSERDLQRSLSEGKYKFMLSVIPSITSSRPDGVSPGTAAGRSLYNFMLSSHMLEVGTGRYARIPHERRWCRKCYLQTGRRVVGDEQHSLTECVRAADMRKKTLDSIACIFGQEQVPLPAGSTIVDILKSIGKLPYKKQQHVWSKVGSLTAALRHAIKTEMASSDQVPNLWMQLARSSLIKSVGAAAERYHRKNLRRRMRSMPARPTIQVSDESESEVELISYRSPLHPDPTLCNAAYRYVCLMFTGLATPRLDLLVC